MYWNSQTPSAMDDLDVNCTVCGKKLGQHDLFYWPGFSMDDDDENRADLIHRIWGVDPFNDFNVCEDCLDGYCDEVGKKTANKWLENQAVKRGM